jgi:tetrapyrrole methylase family protein/MazG family protein
MLYLVGLGAGGAQELSEQALHALRRAPRVFVSQPTHPSTRLLQLAGVAFELCPAEPKQAVATLLHAPERTVALAVPGHPLLGNPLVRTRCPPPLKRDAPCDSCPAAARWSLCWRRPCTLRPTAFRSSARRDCPMSPPTRRCPTLWFGIETPERLRALQAHLSLRYPPSHEVIFVHAPGDVSIETRRVPLAQLTAMPCDALTYLLVPACPRREQTYAGFEGLARVVAALRAPDGCPWDREQTHESLKPHLLEETYETLEAIDRADPAELREELGDLLLQVLMHSQIASETGAFDIEQVVQHLTEKLIARHPHVFGDAHAETAAQVLKNWDATKRQQKGRDSVLDGVPRSMPALARAQEISKRAARVGFEWDSIDGVLDKLREEETELRQAIESGDSARIASELGDLLFTVVNIARHAKVDAEQCLRQMVDRFTVRFQWMEAEAARQNRPLESLSPDEWEALWQQAKRELD